MGGRRQRAKIESSRITVVGCFAHPIWIIAKRRCSIASARQLRAESTSTPSTSLLPGTAPSLDWPSTVSSSFATACTWNLIDSFYPSGSRRNVARKNESSNRCWGLGVSDKWFSRCHSFHFFLPSKTAVAAVNPCQPPLATLPLALRFIQLQNWFSLGGFSARWTLEGHGA